MFNLFRSLFLLSTVFFPIISFAAGPFDSAIKDGDISMIFLSNLFGSLTPNGGTDAFGDAISTFNQAVLMVGGILATYTILAGTLGTAHEGEAFGKKFSSVWIPIRYVLGTALVLPVLPSGYCVMQQLVMWCIIQGVGMANLTWSAYLGSAHTKPDYKLTSSDIIKVREFASNVALAQICTQANASMYNDSSTYNVLLSPVGLSYNYGVAYATDGSGHVYFGDQGASDQSVAGQVLWNNKVNCGNASLPVQQTTSAISPTATTYQGKLGAIGDAFKTPDISGIYKAQEAQSKILITQLGTAATAAINSKSAMAVSNIDTAVDTYVKGIEASANTYVSSSTSPFEDIKKASEEHGWIMAGGWFTKYILVNNSIRSALSSIPTADYTFQMGSRFRFLDRVTDVVKDTRKDILADLNIQEASIAEEEKNSESKSTSSGWSWVVQKVVGFFTGINLEELQNTSQHPLIVMSDAGQRMVRIWDNAAVGLIGLSVGAGFVLGASAAITLMGFLFIPLTALLGLGLTLGYVLPNLPFLMWIGIILSWLIMSIEAIIAAPLWAVMHLHPNGDDLTGRGGNGYMLLLGLLLRPTLTIFGLIGALTVTELMGEFVNKTFFFVINTTQQTGFGSGFGLSTVVLIIFSLILYTSAMVELMKKTFSLMHVIPDQLMRWIGGSGESMGQYAGGLSGSAEKAGQAGQQSGSFVSDRAAQSIGNAKNQYDTNEDRLKNKQNAQLTEDKNAVGKLNEQESSQESALNQLDYLNNSEAGESLKEDLNSINMKSSGLIANADGSLSLSSINSKKMEEGKEAHSQFVGEQANAQKQANTFNDATKGTMSRLANNPTALNDFTNNPFLTNNKGENISIDDYQAQNPQKSTFDNTIDFLRLKEKQALNYGGGSSSSSDTSSSSGDSSSYTQNEKKNNNIVNTSNDDDLNTQTQQTQSSSPSFSLSDTNAVAADGITPISVPGGTDASNRQFIVSGGSDASNTAISSYGNQTPNQSNPDIGSSSNIVDNNSTTNFRNED